MAVHKLGESTWRYTHAQGKHREVYKLGDCTGQYTQLGGSTWRYTQARGKHSAVHKQGDVSKLGGSAGRYTSRGEVYKLGESIGRYPQAEGSTGPYSKAGGEAQGGTLTKGGSA